MFVNNNTIYEHYNVNQFNQNIEELMNKVNLKKLQVGEPNINEINAINEHILNYLKINKRKIYGGYALEYLIKDKSKVDTIYKEYEIPDIDFYTPEPMNDLIAICDLLHTNNFKSVRGRESMHKETYGIYVSNRLFCNITYVPKNIYNNIPFKIINNLFIVHPYFMTIDYLRIFTDPVVSYWRLEKSFERFILLNKYYPLPYNNKKIIFDANSQEKQKLLDIILNHTKKSDSLLHTGMFAYNYFLTQSKIKTYEPLIIQHYELISTNFKIDALKIIELITNTTNKDKIKINEHYKFFQFLDNCVKIYYDDNLICSIYNNNDRCVQYKYTTDNDYLVCSFNYTLLYLLSQQMKYKVDGDDINKNLMFQMISHLTEFRKYYFKSTKKSIFDNTPFEDFSLEYKGNTLSPEKIRQTIGEQRKKNNKPFIFAYEPNTNNKKEISNYIFSNTSGNIITNHKKSYLYDNNDILNEELEVDTTE